jgi:hypothetical protein
MTMFRVTTVSGFKMILTDAGKDADGNQLWRQIKTPPPDRDTPHGLDAPYDWASAAWNGT